jgi:hypothetical protein
VYHIRIIAKKKIGSHDMKQTDSSIIIVRNVYVLTSASMMFWMKKIFPGKFNMEYGGTFTKLFVHASSRNMLPTKSANRCACLSSSPLGSNEIGIFV